MYNSREMYVSEFMFQGLYIPLTHSGIHIQRTYIRFYFARSALKPNCVRAFLSIAISLLSIWKEFYLWQ